LRGGLTPCGVGKERPFIRKSPRHAEILNVSSTETQRKNNVKDKIRAHRGGGATEA
jgi:hypothetical protein